MTARRVGFGCLLLLGALLPFETEAGLDIGPLTLTSLELALVPVLACALMVAASEKRLPVPLSWVALLALFVVGLVLSALLAPQFQSNALLAAGRTLEGVLLVPAAALLVRNRRQLVGVAVALVAGAVLSSLAGLAEIALDRQLEWLNAFRQEGGKVATLRRLTGSFIYPNAAAMFLEAVVPIAAALTWWWWRRRQLFLAALAGATTAVLLEAVILTFSRTTLLVIVASGPIAALATLRGWRKLPAASVPFLLLPAFAIALVSLTLAESEALRLRLAGGSPDEWYRVEYELPKHLHVARGRSVSVDLEVTNRGRLSWSDEGSAPVRLGGRLYRLPENEEITSDLRWSLPDEVQPGESIRIEAALPPIHSRGTYRLEWDVVEEGKAWFSLFTDEVAVTTVIVGHRRRPPPAEASRLVQSPARDVAPYVPPAALGRRMLWGIALERLRDHPLSGIGLDNFRLTYGASRGLRSWDETITVNNWYLETLVSAGLIGSLPFFVWLALLARDVVRRLRESAPTVWQLAIAAGLAAFLLHGFLDYFLLFNTTGFLFWLLVGLWATARTMR